jgi:hypothetical protein
MGSADPVASSGPSPKTKNKNTSIKIITIEIKVKALTRGLVLRSMRCRLSSSRRRSRSA